MRYLLETLLKNHKNLIGIATTTSLTLAYLTYNNNNNTTINRIKSNSTSKILRSTPLVIEAKEKPETNDEPPKENLEKQIKQFSSIISNPRKRMFTQYASVEYEGLPYMTPYDFIDSITGTRIRPFSRRKQLTKKDVEKIIKDTPPLSKSSTKFFRNLENREPHSNFEIAFNMFDIDGNQRIDRKEFLVVTKIFQRDADRLTLEKLKKISSTLETSGNVVQIDDKIDEEFLNANRQLLNSIKVIDIPEQLNTTLLVHLFGKSGDKVLYFNDFKKFMDCLQIEMLEVEFHQFSKGLDKISEMEFAEILLEYTEFTEEKRNKILYSLESQIEEYSRGITFEKFLKFSEFMNNLDDFSLAIKYHLYANGSISKSEFQRAIKVSSGYELDPQIVDVIFKVFDDDHDGNLSYKEFIDVMKDRLKRNPKSLTKDEEKETSFFEEFKVCLKQKMRTDP